MFLVVEGQNSTCSRLNLPLLFISKAKGLKVLFRSRALLVTSNDLLATNLCQFLQKRPLEGGEKKQTTRMAVAKLFALHVNSIMKKLTNNFLINFSFSFVLVLPVQRYISVWKYCYQ